MEAVEKNSTREWANTSPSMRPLEDTVPASIFAFTTAFSPMNRSEEALISPWKVPLIISGFWKVSTPEKLMSSARIVSMSVSSTCSILTSLMSLMAGIVA